MLTDHPANSLRMERHFAAPPHLVFGVWTRPELVEVWFGSSHGFRAQDCTIDLRPGGTWRLRNIKGDVTEHVTGVYHETVPGRRLSYTYHYEGTAFHSVISVEFHEAEGGTRIQFLQTGFPDRTSRDEHDFGWTFVFRMMQDALLAAHGIGSVWPAIPDKRMDGVARDLELARERAETGRERLRN